MSKLAVVWPQDEQEEEAPVQPGELPRSSPVIASISRT